MADRDYFQELSDLDDAPEAEEPAVGVSETARALETDGVFKSLTDQQAQDREVERGKGIFGSFYEAVSGAVTGMRNDPALRSLALTPIEGAITVANSPIGPGEASKGLARGYANVRGSLASGVEQYATSAGFDGLAGAAGEQAKGMRDLAMSKALKSRVKSLGKISKEDWFKDTIDYGLSAVGEGIGSSAPFAAAGIVGGLPGVLALGYTSSLGELREELQQAGITDEPTVAKYAYLAAIPHSILDTLTERGVMKDLTAPAKKEVRRGILRLIMGGAVREGVTEASQRVIELAATAHANGGEAPNAAVIASLFADVNKGADSTILESGVRGALPGAVFGAGTAAAQEARVRTRGTTADVEPGAAATQEAAPPDSRVINLDGYSPVPLQREQDAPQGGTEARPVTTTATPLETVEAVSESTAGQETGVPTGVAASEVPKGAVFTDGEFDPYATATRFAESNEAVPEDLSSEQMTAVAAEANEVVTWLDGEIEKARVKLRPESAESQFASDRRAYLDRKAALSALEARRDRFTLTAMDFEATRQAREETAAAQGALSGITQAVASDSSVQAAPRAVAENPEASRVIEQIPSAVVAASEKLATLVERSVGVNRKARLAALAEDAGLSLPDEVFQGSLKDIKAEIARAVSRHGSSQAQERIVSAANKYGDRIFTGANHGLADEAAVAALGDDVVSGLIDSGQFVDGFITSTGRFVERQEAAAIAGEKSSERLIEQSKTETSQGVEPAESEPDPYYAFRNILTGPTPLRPMEWPSQLGVSSEDMNGLVDRAIDEGLLKATKSGTLRRAKPAAPKPRRLGERLAEVMNSEPSETAARLVSQAAPLAIAPDVRIDRAVELRERQTGKAVPSVVTDYANRIEQARGTPEFQPIIDAIKADRLMKKSDVHDLAHLVGYPVPKSTTKQDALQTVVKRHQELLAPGPASVRLAALAAVSEDITLGQSNRRVLDGLGFYSRLDEALKEFNPTDSVTAETLAKRGVKKAEIEARGMGDLLADGKAAKVSDLQEAAGKSAVEVRESNYGPLTETDLDNVYVAAADDLEAAGADRSQINRFLGQALSYHRTETPTFDAEARQFLPAHLVEQGKAAAQRIFQAEKDTKWRRYSLDPDNPTYRETVLHLPGANRETLSYDAWRKQRWPNLPDDAEMRAKYERSDKLSNLDTPEFRSGHFSEPNIIAHARTSVQKDAQGNDVFVVNELQSDWGQKLRDGGVRDEAKIAEAKAAVESSRQVFDAVDRRVTQATGLDRSRTDAERGDALKKAGNYELADELVVASNEYRLDVAELRTAEASTPGHPLVNTTDQWVNTALRRLILQAVEGGADQIAIPSGETVKSFDMGGKEDGISYAYDQMYPKNLRNILQKMDKSVAGTKLDHLYSVNGKTLERSKGFTTFTLTDKIKRSVASEGFALFSLAGSGRPTPPLTPEFEEAVPDLVDSLFENLQAMLPPDVVIRIKDRVYSGGFAETFGKYDPVARVVEIATTPFGVYSPGRARMSARHETIHALRMIGLFSPQEWELLVNHAGKIGLDKSIIDTDPDGKPIDLLPLYEAEYRKELLRITRNNLMDRGYSGDVLDQALEDYKALRWQADLDELLNQERVAKMAETWFVGQVTYSSKIEALLARIKKFFEALNKALADLGFQTADDVFQKVFSGEIAGRSLGPGTNTGPTLYSLRSAGIPSTAVSIAPFSKDTEIKSDPDYKAAKSGDHEAAGRLVERLVPPEIIQSAAAQFGPDAIYVPVIAEEASGNNKIPEMLAHLFGIATGAHVSDDIVQSSRAFHTGARPLERLISRPRFDGPVEAGRRYVLVDDVSVMGGTLAELANHIVSNGGEVAGVVTLVNASRTGEIAPNAKDIAEIEKRYGSLVRDQLGIEPQALTGDEARYILNFRDADALGSSIAKARRERNERLRAKGLRPSEEDPEGGLSLASIASVPGDRAKSTSDSLTGTTINVPAELFRWLGVPQAKMQADYSGIARKREASPSADVDLTKPEMVRDFVEDVLTRATFAYRAHADHPSLWDIIVPDTSNRMIGVRLERRGGLYKVSTAHTMRERQVAKKLVAAAREHGPAGIRWKDAPAASTVLAFINRGVASPSGSSTAATLNDVEREGPEHPAIAAVIAALTRSQEGDPEILASIGRLGSGTPVLSADTNRQDTARPEQTLADLVKSVTRALGLTVRQGHIDPGLKRSAAARGNQVAGQFSQATGVTRLAIPNDLATLAHEGGHALEVRPSIRADLDTLKQAHVEELAVAPVQNTPAPTLAPGQGFSGLELDAETQTLAQGAAEADITWRALAASVGAAKAGGGIVSAGTYDQAAYTAAQEEAAASRAALVRRLGRPTADAVIADITKAERQDKAAWIAARYSATGTPQSRPAVTATATELSEGFAEWFRVYVTNRREAASLAPRFMAAFEDMLGEVEPELLDALSEIERQVDGLTKASPIGALRSRVQSTVTPGMFQALREEIADKGLGDTIGDRVYGFYHAFFDARHPMKRAVKFLLRTAADNLGLDLQGKDRLLVKAIDDPYKLWRLSEHSKVHATAALQNGITNTKAGQVDPQGPSFWDALVAAFGGKSRSAWSDENAELFGSYLVARRMLAEFQRFDRGDLEQLPDQVISRDIWNRAKTQLEQKYPDFQAAASLLYAFNRNALKLKLDNGFLSQEVYDDLIQRPDYVPLNRIMDDGSPSALGTSARGTNKRRLIYKFQGSTRDFINPLESIVQDMYATQARIALNDVIRAMDRLARAAGPGGGAIAERLPASEMKGTTVDLREAIKAAARSQNIAQSDKEGLLDIIDDLFDQDAAATIFRTTEINEKGEPIVYLWEGGKKVPIRLGDNRIAKDVFDGFAAFGQDNQNLILDVAALGTQALRAGITKAPAYIMTNFLRDQIATWILSENFTPFATGAKGLKHVVANDQTAARYSAFAGLMGGVDANLIDTAAHKRDVLTLRRKGFSAVPAKSGIGQVWQTVLRAMEVTEAGSRFGHFEAAYQRAIKDGLSPVEAAYEAAYAAHDVMDFSRRGSKMVQVSRIIAFLNASLQGLDVARRTMTGERDSYQNFREQVTPYLKAATGSPLTIAEKKALPNSARFWMKAVAIGMAGVALAALYRDDEEYEEFDDQMRATHWFFKINGTWWRVPKPFELAFFSNLFEAGFDRMWKGNERALTQFLQSLRHTMIPPHEINVVKSYYEWQTGVDLFRGSKIVPTELGALPPEMQFTAYTSELGKLIGSIANLSPAQVDQVMGAMLGTVGRDIMRASDAALPRVNMLLDGALPGVATEPRAEKSFEDSWIVSRFTRRASRGSLSARQFWNEMAQDGGKFIQAAEGYKNLRRAGDVRGARDLIDYLGDEEKAYAYLEGEFTEEEQDIHPLNRARQVLAVSSGIRKNLVLGRLFKDGTVPDAEHKYREPEEIIVSPAKQTAVNEILEDISMREARNALVLVGEPGWAQRDVLPVEPLLEELRKAAPEVAEEFEARLTKGKNKVYPFEGVAKVWPLAKGRLIKDGPDADLTDLRIEAAYP